MMTFINAYRAGITLSPTNYTRLALLLENMVATTTGHVDQWYLNTADYFRLFMGALTAYALTELTPLSFSDPARRALRP
ncbi:MAG: hypothetical protein C0467_26185 [Planctomycetaceae bacterium]|nr:hypothetical protein [Planctomycetaceae bacterium]